MSAAPVTEYTAVATNVAPPGHIVTTTTTRTTTASANAPKLTFPIILLLLQVIFIILFALHSDYGHEPKTLTEHELFSKVNTLIIASRHRGSVQYPNGTFDPNIIVISEPHRGINDLYSMFQDIHIMIFIGFGFLMTFLKRYGYSAVGYNFLIAAFVLEWALLIRGYMFDFDFDTKKFPIDVERIIVADFVAAAILISFGALLGKTTPTQLIIMCLIEVVLQSVNEWIGLRRFCAFDIGESMFVHVFGAYFGIAVSIMLYDRALTTNTHVEEKEKPVYHSDLFSMVGTLFLFCFWPSFNAGVAAAGDARLRAVVNTYISISASVLLTYILSSVLGKGKFEMVHIQNATLAGGVAVGTVADKIIRPAGALLVGSLAGSLSTVGFKIILPILKKLKIHDTCGVNNLHGMPGILAAVVGIILASMPNYSLYNDNLARSCFHGVSRTPLQQVGYQAATLGVTLLIAIGGGLITGFILRLPIFNKKDVLTYYDDDTYWDTPADFHYIDRQEKDRLIVLERDVLHA
ncbi:unnamed protein product [Didymodactylos carnosus]|uniref:Ammonium transporter AmtB-like domain-containing protein n=1 Tax=Didymodactylos carnosus TaxID=1234261 RepID=A0A813ZXQ8_9BILA|nr:unnamed protein product [Didymodactylos carnosus]CAF0914170.1 unnamed protein product [Didymodactylos carnosus]CAF3686649.1 unnamed protein product [Didymodactylos carnosus]CAF3692767.1 unnamed protein product [Didymodactylos carnosus]